MSVFFRGYMLSWASKMFSERNGGRVLDRTGLHPATCRKSKEKGAHFAWMKCVCALGEMCTSHREHDSADTGRFAKKENKFGLSRLLW